jgi:hypothetical protein
VNTSSISRPRSWPAWLARRVGWMLLRTTLAIVQFSIGLFFFLASAGFAAIAGAYFTSGPCPVGARSVWGPVFACAYLITGTVSWLVFGGWRDVRARGVRALLKTPRFVDCL